MQQGRSDFNRPRNYDSGNPGNPKQPAAPVVSIRELNGTNFADYAEKVIKKHKEEKQKITTTQPRGLFALMTEVREILRVRQDKKLDENLISRVQYIKMRFAYAAGRGEKGVDAFMKQSDLIAALDTVQDSVRQFELICKYMEALVAYHKYYIGG